MLTRWSPKSPGISGPYSQTLYLLDHVSQAWLRVGSSHVISSVSMSALLSTQERPPPAPIGAEPHAQQHGQHHHPEEEDAAGRAACDGGTCVCSQMMIARGCPVVPKVLIQDIFGVWGETQRASGWGCASAWKAPRNAAEPHQALIRIREEAEEALLQLHLPLG